LVQQLLLVPRPLLLHTEISSPANTPAAAAAVVGDRD
jgi:hypothetical protein